MGSEAMGFVGHLWFLRYIIIWGFCFGGGG